VGRLGSHCFVCNFLFFELPVFEVSSIGGCLTMDCLWVEYFFFSGDYSQYVDFDCGHGFLVQKNRVQLGVREPLYS